MVTLSLSKGVGGAVAVRQAETHSNKNKLKSIFCSVLTHFNKILNIISTILSYILSQV